MEFLTQDLSSSKPGDDNVSPGRRLQHQQASTAPVDGIEESKREDQIAKLDDAEVVPTLNGDGRYNIELSIDDFTEDTIRTTLGTIRPSTSGLSIFNGDGLQPKLASDLDNFNNGFLGIKKSSIAGYGIFAVRDLERYTTILIERELFNANPMNLFQKIEDLTAEQSKAYHALHAHERDPSTDIRVSLWRTNRFDTGGSTSSVFLVASRFNHACYDRNNVTYSYNHEKKCMVFQAKAKVSAGEELFISYGKNPIGLFMNWGFRCRCGACQGISDEKCNEILADPWDRAGW